MKSFVFKESLRNFSFWLSRIVDYPLLGPEIIQIPLTNRCNLDCKMCNIKNSADSKELASLEVKEILKQAKNMGVKEAVLTGGEPFLRDDIFEIGHFCSSNNLRAVVTTNGTLINPAMAEKIVSCGLSHVHFSVDGYRETNDFFRGEGNFDKTIKAIEIINRLRSNNKFCPSIGVACTVMDNNIGDLFKLVKFLDGLNVDVMNFQPLVKDNTNMRDRGETIFWVSKENLNCLQEEIDRIKKYDFKHINIYEQTELRLLNKYYSREITFSDWKCFSGYKTLFICTSDKDILVYACHGICGNLRNNTLRECWVSSAAKRVRKESKKCKNPCLQSCYSRPQSESLTKILINLARILYE